MKTNNRNNNGNFHNSNNYNKYGKNNNNNNNNNNKNNNHMNNGNNCNNGNYKTFTTKKIDIESIYENLKKQLSIRNQCQSEQDELWKKIKKYHCNLSVQMNSLSITIGKCTYEIDKLIGQLSQYKKTHKAMNLATDYLQKEIYRVKKIIESNQRTINSVESGYSVLISSDGNQHTNTNHLREYVHKKLEKLERYQRWLNAIQNYCVR